MNLNILKELKINNKESPKANEIIDNSKSQGRWSKQEHQTFIEGVTKFGKNWKKVTIKINLKIFFS